MTNCDKCGEKADHVKITVLENGREQAYHIDLCKQCQIKLAVDMKDFIGKEGVPRFAPMKAGGIRL